VIDRKFFFKQVVIEMRTFLLSRRSLDRHKLKIEDRRLSMRQLARWPWGGISVTAASLPSTQCTRVVAPVASFLRQIPSSQRWKQKTSLDYFEAKAKKKQAVRRQAQLRRDAKMSGIPPEKHMPFGHPEFIFTVDPSVCTGCGVKLQHEKPGTLGYYVRIKTPPAEKKKKPNSQKVNEFYKERLQDINHETRVLLQNTQNHVMEDKPKYAVRFENARDRTERKRVEEANAVHLVSVLWSLSLIS